MVARALEASAADTALLQCNSSRHPALLLHKPGLNTEAVKCRKQIKLTPGVLIGWL